MSSVVVINQRARSAEQKALRRDAVLQAAETYFHEVESGPRSSGTGASDCVADMEVEEGAVGEQNGGEREKDIEKKDTEEKHGVEHEGIGDVADNSVNDHKGAETATQYVAAVHGELLT